MKQEGGRCANRDPLKRWKTNKKIKCRIVRMKINREWRAIHTYSTSHHVSILLFHYIAELLLSLWLMPTLSFDVYS